MLFLSPLRATLRREHPLKRYRHGLSYMGWVKPAGDRLSPLPKREALLVVNGEPVEDLGTRLARVRNISKS